MSFMLCRKLFADEEAIETARRVDNPDIYLCAGNCSLMKKRLRQDSGIPAGTPPKCRKLFADEEAIETAQDIFLAVRNISAGNCSLMKKRLRRQGHARRRRSRACRKLFADEEAIETTEALSSTPSALKPETVR